MKKIAFFVQWMLCGGVENALVSLTKELADQGHDITIFVISNEGEFIKKVEKPIKLETIPMPEKIRANIPIGGTKVSVRNCIINKNYIKAIKFIFTYIINHSSFAELNVDLDDIPKLPQKYDIAVNFHIHSPFLVWYLSERVNAQIKYSWIHNDFKTTGYDICRLKDYLQCINGFFAVAKDLADEFISRIPEYKNITYIAHNIVPSDKILEQAKEFYPKEYKVVPDNFVKILTVGRLEEQKGYDIAIKVCAKLKLSGKKIDWFILGDGTQKKSLLREIKKQGISDCFHLIGTRMNPYPYFKNCDIYVQTSKHEGYVTTVTEAKIFERPIVTTDVSGAKEQIIDGKTGDIADISVESVYEKLSRLIDENDRRSNYSEAIGKSKKTVNYTYLTKFI